MPKKKPAQLDMAETVEWQAYPLPFTALCPISRQSIAKGAGRGTRPNWQGPPFFGVAIRALVDVCGAGTLHRCDQRAGSKNEAW